MEHATSHTLHRHTVRPELNSGFAAAGRTFARLTSWLASDPVGDRLERQHDDDAQLILRAARRTSR